MNKAMAAAVVILAAAVLLLSGAVFYMSKYICAGQSGPGGGPGIQMQRPIAFPMNQPRPGPENMPSVFGPDGQSQMPPPGGRPDMMGGPTMGGQQGQPQQRGPGMRGGQGMQGRPGEQGMSGAQGQGQSGLREQISQSMQEAQQEAQNYFKGQNRRPEHQEMLAKVKELMSQKMNAQGISQDDQQKVLSDMDKKSPPQQSQQRQ